MIDACSLIDNRKKKYCCPRLFGFGCVSAIENSKRLPSHLVLSLTSALCVGEQLKTLSKITLELKVNPFSIPNTLKFMDFVWIYSVRQRYSERECVCGCVCGGGGEGGERGESSKDSYHRFGKGIWTMNIGKCGIRFVSFI